MAETKSTDGGGRAWSDAEIEQLRALAKGNTPTGLIAVRLGRSGQAIEAKAAELGIPLAPPHRPPASSTADTEQ
ncbi:hypothetical protein [Kribbella deserti]|uniref:Transposase n=1 Tax=Kribbella deserti TaxID=1926257 RepID=A0ABV6QDZ3_9ACTN